MARINNVKASKLAPVKSRVRRTEMSNNLDSGSVDNGTTTYRGNESLKVVGSALVSGWLIVTGTLKVVGTFLLEGITTITGALNINGPSVLNGNLAVGAGGAISVGGVTIAPASGGKIVIAGALPMTIGTTSAGRPGVAFPGGVLSSSSDRIVMEGGGTVGVIAATTFAALYYDSAHTLAVSASGTNIVGGLSVTGAKSFVMPHPLKDGWELRHGATESPVSGTEYWGEGTFDSAGTCVVLLPEYFEALNKAANRTVTVTPIGRPFMVGADRVVDGAFTAYGDSGRGFTWVVKAERFGGDFLVEQKGVQLDLDVPANESPTG